MRTCLAALVCVGALLPGCGASVSPGGGDESTGAADTNDEPTSTTTGDAETEGTTEDPSDPALTDESGSTGPTGECGNGIVEGNELCDGDDLAGESCSSQGFDEGMLVCDPDCQGFDIFDCILAECGDGVKNEDELCDGPDVGDATCESEGFDNGQLVCMMGCHEYDTSVCGICGNGVIDGTEVCDGGELGGEACDDVGFDNGTLGCASDCLDWETSGCGTCGNGAIDGSEVCDGDETAGATCLTLSFDSGTLGSCNSDCLAFDTSGCGICGNDVIDGDELCDGVDVTGSNCVTEGFDNGTLVCAAGGCGAYDTSGCGICGNGVIDGSESCDGTEFGGETCESLGLLGGDLGCSSACQYDFADCDIPGIPFGSDSGYSGYALTPPSTTCDDISATGTSTGLSDDDNVVVMMGFDFAFYGVDYDEVNIQSNGTLRFGDNLYLTYFNTCVPSPTNPSDNTLYVFWDDLNPGAAGDVYYETLGVAGDQRFVVQWDVPHFAGNNLDLMRFQAVLHEATGQIDVCYVDTLSAGNSGDSGAEATAGIQTDSTDGLEYSCDSADLLDGLQLLYVPV